MPTPESEAFLAKKPTVPPTFEGVDYDDNKRLKQAQDAIIREQWVQVMMGRLVREELSKCYYREGVNHLEKCGALRGQCYSHPCPEGGALRSQAGSAYDEDTSKRSGCEVHWIPQGSNQLTIYNRAVYAVAREA
jgi:hypothetical protein